MPDATNDSVHARPAPTHCADRDSVDAARATVALAFGCPRCGARAGTRCRENGGVCQERLDGVETLAVPILLALLGPDPLDPRWTWLGGAAAALRAHACGEEDEEPPTTFDAAHELDVMRQAISHALHEAGRGPDGADARSGGEAVA
jgi:hypothetical protein